jgi:uncharacterized protein
MSRSYITIVNKENTAEIDCRIFDEPSMMVAMNGPTEPDPVETSDAPEQTDPLALKLLALRRELARTGPLLVSYSGGVDSALLAVVARDVLGDGMVCAFVDDAFVPRAAVADARRIAQEYDLPLVVIRREPFDDPDLTANPPDRCYHCKKASAPLLWREAAGRGMGTVVDGANVSDCSEHRPGLRACTEEGIEHPFITTGITKPEIRAIARHLGLSCAEKPSAACLASRIPYGEPLTSRVLAMVEEAEEALTRSVSLRDGSASTDASPVSRCRRPSSRRRSRQRPTSSLP